MAEPLFSLGQVVMTPGAMELMHGVNHLFYLQRHQTGDWGEVDQYDWRQNDAAVESGNRVLSAYTIPQGANGVRIWIITEADRSVTTLLLPEEY